MAFVNEFVPKEDIKKYGLEEINRRHFKSDVQYKWTVDRDHDVYLRWMDSGREESHGKQRFTFYWKGALLFLPLAHSYQKTGNVVTLKWRFLWRHPSESLIEKNPEIIADLKEALTAYTARTNSKDVDHVATFEF
ncbi:MAG: hypothetical protein AABY95_01880 [Pseudomonadota bacterium]